MIKVYNYDGWVEYSGAAEGSGRSEKVWLTNEQTEEIGLFKFPKVRQGDDKYSKPRTTEHVSEKLATSIAKELGLDTARVEIGYRDGRIGCMSYLITKNKEYLKEGIHFINMVNPEFNKETLYDASTGEYYSLPMILKAGDIVLPEKKEKNKFIVNIWAMMLFDMLIGNTDRHQSNWGIIGKMERQKELVRFAPFYDNGSSLCAYIEEEAIDKYIGNDEVKFNSLVDSKSKSRIRINLTDKKEPRHTEVIKHLFDRSPSAISSAVDLISTHITEGWIDEVLAEYPEEILSIKKKTLIRKFLLRKVELLKEICREGENNEQ